MFVFVLVLLLTAKISNGLECIGNCTVGDFAFGEKFHLREGQCSRHIADAACTIRTTFKYHDQTYSVELGKDRSTADFIYISSTPYLSYTINHYCLEDADCVFSNLQNEINHMVSHSFNAANIYSQIAPLIDNPSRNGPVECYTMTDEIIHCPLNYTCGLSYDQHEEKIRARGCQLSPGHSARVYVYDADYYSAFHIECTRNLCNDLATFEKVKQVLSDNRLLNASGTQPPAMKSSGIQPNFSFLLLVFVLSTLSFYLSEKLFLMN